MLRRRQCATTSSACIHVLPAGRFIICLQNFLLMLGCRHALLNRSCIRATGVLTASSTCRDAVGRGAPLSRFRRILRVYSHCRACGCKDHERCGTEPLQAGHSAFPDGDPRGVEDDARILLMANNPQVEAWVPTCRRSLVPRSAPAPRSAKYAREMDHRPHPAPRRGNGQPANRWPVRVE